ncbi:3,4-dihydroxy-2-butanone 4-phosphate synthase-domain-containing protein [Zopfochytrium polystomum]|nr:3,4-dihydroxy-2-butanone 4-phosphate synthase-domain-containing protein [Zopfochytrium polystomum]
MPAPSDQVRIEGVAFLRGASLDTLVPRGSIAFSATPATTPSAPAPSPAPAPTAVARFSRLSDDSSTVRSPGSSSASDRDDAFVSASPAISVSAPGYLVLPGLVNTAIVLGGASPVPGLEVLGSKAYDLSLALSSGTTSAVVISQSPVFPSKSAPKIHHYSTAPTKSNPPGMSTGNINLSPPNLWLQLHAAAKDLIAKESNPRKLEAGLLQLLRSATVEGGQYLGSPDLGMIEEGAIADFVVIRLPPVAVAALSSRLNGNLNSGLRRPADPASPGSETDGAGYPSAITQLLSRLFLSPPTIGACVIDAIFISGHPVILHQDSPFGRSWTSATLGSYYTPQHAASLGTSRPSARAVALGTSPAAAVEAGFDSIESAIEAFRRGEFVVAVDNEDRENEGDLILPAQDATPEKMAFMIRHTSGLICVPMEAKRLEELELPLMVQKNEDTFKTAYTISVDLRGDLGTTTGISSEDRAKTIKALGTASTTAQQFQRPGHVFPLRAQPGGVLRRVGHTEASVDLAKLAGKEPAAAICEIVLDEGGMARRDELMVFARKWGLKIITIADLVRYRQNNGFGEDW